MKLKSIPALAGKEMVLHGDIKVKFDSAGLCEVKDDLGKEMLEKYPSMVFSEKFVEDKPKTKKDEFNESMVNQLTLDLATANESITSLKEELANSIKDKEAWTEQVPPLKEAKEKAETELAAATELNAKTIGRLNLHIELLKSNSLTLKKMCEMSGFPKEEWEVLTVPKLIDYILGKN